MCSLGAASKAETSRAFVVESPDAKSVTSAPAVDEAVGEQLHDGLDSAVAIGRDGEPDGAEERDAHYVSFTTMVPFLTSTDQTRPSGADPFEPRSLEPVREPRRGSVTRTPSVGSGRSPSSSVRQSTGAPAAHAWGRAAVG